MDIDEFARLLQSGKPEDLKQIVQTLAQPDKLKSRLMRLLGGIVGVLAEGVRLGRHVPESRARVSSLAGASA
jgi:hypothetical protein